MKNDYRFTFSIEGATAQQFVPGNSVVVKYATTPGVAKKLRQTRTGKSELIIRTAKLAPNFGNLLLFTGWIPDIGLRVTGGFNISDQNGWFLTQPVASALEQ